jgi:hypothetical protein
MAIRPHTSVVEPSDKALAHAPHFLRVGMSYYDVDIVAFLFTTPIANIVLMSESSRPKSA